MNLGKSSSEGVSIPENALKKYIDPTLQLFENLSLWLIIAQV
jgi:hypothetical protein